MKPEHYGNNRNHNQLANTEENLRFRPRHISLTIDLLLSEQRFREHIAADRIMVIGHSTGGYTALALASGVPRTREEKEIDVTADRRMAPLSCLRRERAGSDIH